MKDYMYTVTDDGNVSLRISHLLHISWSTWCSLAPNGLADQSIDWVKLILHELIYLDMINY